MKTTGNTILVTGGGTGIGEALTHRFHDLGNTVIIAGRRMDALKKAIGDRPRMHALTLDIDDAANVAGFAEKLVADFPGMNVLINNASIMRMETALDKRPRSARCGGLHHQQPARSDPGHQRAGRASRQAARCRKSSMSVRGWRSYPR
jgi:short-subunit dehydrogenase involved in D-alanine esterification of teichoic acids